MAEPNLSSPSGIREIRFNAGSDGSGSDPYRGMGENPNPSPKPGIRKVSLRAEIDTSLPFESVKEAVTRFGGHGPWVNPLYKLGDNYHDDEEVFDIKRVEEQTAELEKDLIVKELETLDVLEELTTTKRIVEELKRQLHNEASKPVHFHDHPITNYNNNNNNNNIIPTTSSPSDLILAELNRAKLSLGKTITDLGAIQTSVESLTKKMITNKDHHHKEFLITATDDHHHHRRSRSDVLKATAEMRWAAAKKMGEAARAAEAVALAEINAALDNNNNNNNNNHQFLLSEPDKVSFNFRVRSPPPKMVRNFADKAAVMRKMKEASEEVRLGKQAMEEAFIRVDLASKKQIAVEEALNRLLWIGGGHENNSDRKRHVVCYGDDRYDSPVVDRRGIVDDKYDAADIGSKPVLKTTVSMRDVLSKKQNASCDQEYRYDHRIDNGHNETRKVALSDMLQSLRDDQLNLKGDYHIPVTDNNTNHNHINPRKQFLTGRKKFGFIQISLPLTKPSKKKMVQQSL